MYEIKTFRWLNIKLVHEVGTGHLNLQKISLVIISVTGGIDPKSIVRPERLSEPMIPSRIEPATFQFVAQWLNQQRHRVHCVDGRRLRYYCVGLVKIADAHTSAASSRLNWCPCRFKWTRTFRRKKKSGFCACAVTFRTQSNAGYTMFRGSVRVLATHSIRQFPLHFLSRASPCASHPISNGLYKYRRLWTPESKQ
jgi:hypothetical protein